MAEQDTTEDTGVDNVETEEVDDTEDGADSGTDDGDGAEEQDTWQPPTKDEWEKQQAKLKRANDQAKKLREAQTGPAAKKTVPAPRPGPRPQPAAEPEAQPGIDPAELAKWQSRAVRGEARKALEDRGADRDLVTLALSQLKVDEIDFDRDDSPILDYWLDEMEDKYPKLFAQPQPEPAAPAARPRPGRVDQGAAGGAKVARPPMSLGQQIVANAERAGRQRP
jgi:hypothetical protein